MRCAHSRRNPSCVWNNRFHNSGLSAGVAKAVPSVSRLCLRPLSLTYRRGVGAAVVKQSSCTLSLRLLCFTVIARALAGRHHLRHHPRLGRCWRGRWDVLTHCQWLPRFTTPCQPVPTGPKMWSTVTPLRPRAGLTHSSGRPHPSADRDHPVPQDDPRPLCSQPQPSCARSIISDWTTCCFRASSQPLRTGIMTLWSEVFRPADGNETSGAYKAALEKLFSRHPQASRFCGLLLTLSFACREPLLREPLLGRRGALQV